jgi:hypothetical protein
MADKGSQKALGATQGGPQPGNYPLGSAQSRAAARVRLERRFAARERGELIVSHYMLAPDQIRIGEWKEAWDGTLIRVSHLPKGMTIEEAERIVAERVISYPAMR